MHRFTRIVLHPLLNLGVRIKLLLILTALVLCPTLALLILLETVPLATAKSITALFLIASFILIYPLCEMLSWLIAGKDIKELAEACYNIKHGEYQLRIELPDEADDESEFVKLKRSLNWVAHVIQRKNERLNQKLKEIQEHKRLYRHQAYHDTLTGLPNRLAFYERLERAMTYADSNGFMIAIVFLDLNNFKQINDTLGHSVGDTLLQVIAARLKSCCRAEDGIARFGGDEFVIMQTRIIREEETVSMVYRVFERLGETVVIAGHELYPSASIGITFFPRDGGTVESLIKNADVAMYQAKGGRNGHFAFFDPTMDTRLHKDMVMENHLRRAAHLHEFQAYYQPLVEIDSGRLSGMEALARWHRDDGTTVPPDEFIPLAEKTGLILTIGEQVIRDACRQMCRWHADGFDHLGLSVNISSIQFQDPGLLDRIRALLDETTFPAHLLTVEITESAAMDNVGHTLSTLQSLRAMGIKIAIDDFGTGYSSLGYLKRFPVDLLKIDKSFVVDLPGDADASAIAQTIISMSRTLNIQVAAEGVETEEQYRFMKEHQCHKAQGFLFGRPMVAAAAGEFISRFRQMRT
ncbi:putative bifunctional diguanylate cyclase/phosphodiesterase [Desulfofustis glycolicus]|uniref:Diguanylate cyclase (GGDEF) domain-containing protein n=1 Tax=Desulfofustis glycolicus DSM 9705 TaxID=1121409 RepID=A0A1M5YSQ2_9BACT|nr:EAL domain-containing protein [Desulfofustis glycolicus]SHI14854.1 diguanylate cyclase (GGDEF) domain-containing protein [Desulfofustis glycolicus DSM 9705]